jgi:hypothetical protein
VIVQDTTLPVPQSITTGNDDTSTTTTVTLISPNLVASNNELTIDISNIDDDTDEKNTVNNTNSNTTNLPDTLLKPTEDDSDNESWHSV